MRRELWLAVGLVVQLTAGCSGLPAGNPDGSAVPPPPDGGRDAGIRDGGTLDGGTDAGTPDAGSKRFEYPPLQGSLEQYGLVIPQATLDNFLQDPWAPEQPATFLYRGVEYPVMVRLRGASARFFPKKSWKIDFGETQRFQGRRKLNLVAEYQDCSMMSEKLAYDLLAAMDVPAPRTKFVRLDLNGSFYGVFLDIEQIDKRFLDAHSFADGDANIYRCGWKDCEMKTWKTSYQGDWVKKTNETQPSDDLAAILEVINHTPEPDLEAELESHLELESLLRSTAMDMLLSNDYVEDSESYLVHDRLTGRWSYVPWDLNNVDARWWTTYELGSEPFVTHDLFNFTLTDARTQWMYDRRKDLYDGYLPAFSNLGTRLVLNPALRARLLAAIERAQAEIFNDAVTLPRIDAMHALLLPHLRQDPWIDQEKLDAAYPYLKSFVTRRNAFVRQQLADMAAQGPGLVLETVDPRAGVVELRNRGSAAASLGGMTLTNNLRVTLGRNLPAITLAPGEVARFTMADLSMPLGPAGEVGLFDGQSVVGVVDALFYGPLPDGRRYVRSPSGTWTIR